MTLVIAIIGAATGVASLAWNIISSQRQGPLITLHATCSGRGAEMKITGIVRNRGRFDANLEAAWINWPSSQQKAASFFYRAQLQVQIPSGNISNIAVPGPLPAENGREFVITDIGKIDLGLEVALHDRRQAVIMITTASGKTSGRVINYA